MRSRIALACAAVCCGSRRCTQAGTIRDLSRCDVLPSAFSLLLRPSAVCHVQDSLQQLLPAVCTQVSSTCGFDTASDLS